MASHKSGILLSLDVQYAQVTTGRGRRDAQKVGREAAQADGSLVLRLHRHLWEVERPDAHESVLGARRTETVGHGQRVELQRRRN